MQFIQNRYRSTRAKNYVERVVVNKTVLVIAIVSVILVISSVLFAFKLGYIGEPELKPQLYMEVHDSLETWFRDSHDRPVARYSLDIEVGNSGHGEANLVSVDFSIERDGYIIENGVIPIGNISKNNEKVAKKEFELNDGYYESNLILKTPTKVWESFIDSFTVDFPRRGNGEFVRFYMTPNDPIVRGYLNTIGNDVNALYGWVGDNIHYMYDSETYGVGDYWQFPYETLNLGTGDCEDQAFLLCSLIRVSGTSAENVFVALGEVNGGGHAWVILKTGGGWRVIEPTVEGIIDRFLTDITEFLGLTDREYDSVSNDIYFEEVNPSNNQPYVSQSFQTWHKNGLRLNGSRVTVSVNNHVTLKIKVTNFGYYDFIGFIKIEIKKDIVWGSDVVFAEQRYSITLDEGESQQLELSFTPDEVTQDMIWQCRHYYYKVYTCFACVYDPTDADTRECLFVYS